MTKDVPTKPEAKRPAHLWKPGQSGNPTGGRKRSQLQTLLRERTNNLEMVVDAVVGILSGATRANQATVLDAAKWISERVEGKTPEFHANLNVDASSEFLGTFGELAPDQLRDMARLALGVHSGNAAQTAALSPQNGGPEAANPSSALVDAEYLAVSQGSPGPATEPGDDDK